MVFNLISYLKKFPNNQKLVKPSNTIYAKPSEVSIVRFFRSTRYSNEQCSFLSENLLNNFKGKTFDINFKGNIIYFVLIY